MNKVEVVSTTALSAATSEMAKREKNDCVVRAISAAFDVPYDLAHSFCSVTFKRQVGQGTRDSRPYLAKVGKLFSKEVVEMGDEAYPGANYKLLYTYYKPSKIYFGSEPLVARRMTVHTFLKRYPKGSYVVYVPQHAFAIKDGVVWGNLEDGKRLRQRITAAFEVK